MKSDTELYANVIIQQRPVDVVWHCPKCLENNHIPYKNFIAEYGEPCDWGYEELTCLECGIKVKIRNIDWDKEE